MIGKSLFSVAVATLFTSASAQTAPGFPIPATQQLTVSYGNNTVSPPGERIPRPETAQQPTISTPTWFSSSPGTSDRAVLLMVDLDVPRNNTRVQLVHWIATNITRTSNSTTSQLTIPSPAPVPYLQPSPPVGDSPHSYTFILFPQPANFSVPAQYANLSNNRVPFDVARFVRDAGLGQALAGNWISVQNLTGSATASYPPARPTNTGGANGNGTSEFLGQAVREGSGWMAVWVGVVTAVGAGFAAFAL